MGSVLAIARADFRERLRRSSFLVLLAATVAAAYGFVPARSAHYVTFSYGRIGGVYNSAWIGTLVASLDLVVLSLLGFFVVRDSVERDERTGVGQILATTPMTRLQYTLGKFLSNVLVLGSAVAVTVGMAALMQELRGEVRRIDVVQLMLPFILLVLPGLALVAAFAVLFETSRLLRGAKGSVFYFFLWIGVLTLPVAQAHSGHPKPWLDPFGWSAPMADIQKAVRAHFADYDGSINVGVTVSDLPFRTFVWEGQDFWPVAPWRLGWAFVAVALAAAAALPFHRFDPERMPRRTTSGRRASGRAARSLGRRWTPFFERLAGRSRGLTLLWAELALLVRGRRTGWGLVCLALWLACLLAPLQVVRHFLLPAAWLWPLAAWAEMGNQEARHRTEALVFVCPKPLWRQLPAAYGAGLVLAAGVGSAAAFRFLGARAWPELAAWAVGACFIPALALAAGALSGGPRLFEVSYLLVWYVGLLNKLPLLDFLSPAPGAWAAFLAATLGLLLLATLARRRRLEN
jgi:ABC-type transport system involved in multi-copper enzyme maturation permease subunit